MKQRLKEIVDSTKGVGRYFDLSIQVLIILSLISFSISTLPNLSPLATTLLGYFQVFTVLIFTIEYFLRIYVADRRFDYIFSFFGLIDFFAILPFYLSTAIDLRSLRILRLFRLFRLLKILRYQKAVKRYKMAFKEIKTELIVFLSATAFLLYMASVGIYYFEQHAQPEAFKSVFHSLWWAVATLTTVGYGDVYPVTIGGRVFTFFILMIGLGVVALPAGLFADALRDTPESLKSSE
jgi:voltage-gated potassium channel